MNVPARSAALVAFSIASAACGRIGYDARDARAPDGSDGEVTQDLDANETGLDAAYDRVALADRPSIEASADCAAPLSACHDFCTDYRIDTLNCGACDRMCPLGQRCVDARCEPFPRAAAGSPCMVSTDCADGGAFGICLRPIAGWPNGYCTFHCRNPADCGPGEVCVNDSLTHIELFATSIGVCMRRCPTAGVRDGCLVDQTCALLGVETVCVGACNRMPSVCGRNLCDETSGQCIACMTPLQCGGNDCMGGRCSCDATTNCGPAGRCYMATGRCGCSDDSFCPDRMRCNLETGDCTL